MARRRRDPHKARGTGATGLEPPDGGGRVWVSPAEPDVLRSIGETSSLPERHGMDFLWTAKGTGMVGVQRKAFEDLESSLGDGRLAKELGQANAVALPILVVESPPRFDAEGVQAQSGMKHWRTLDRKGWTGIQASMQAEGWWLFQTDSVLSTGHLVRELVDWTRKGHHGSLRRRPAPSGVWGRASSEEWAVWLLESFPGISQVLAQRIYDHFGRLPLRWEIGRADLVKVPGIGPKKARAMIEAFDAAEPPA